MTRLTVIIPAYQESKRIRGSLEQTRAFFDSLGTPYELIVVDDGSTDGTAEAVGSLASVVKHKTNLGKGAAVRTGTLAATGDWILFLDADLSTKPSAFSNFLPHLENSDLVFGSRRAPEARIGTAQPAWRNGSGQVFNLLVRIMTGLPYQDTQCGFKAFRVAACRPLFESLETTGWAFDVELLMRAKKNGLIIKEVPVEWHHQGESKVRLRHFWKVLKDLMAMNRIS
jgi:glycosyltransferase involved in cell wall biosynthesis